MEQTENVKDKDKAVIRRIFLRVAYDGTNYHGWQLQPQAATVEGVLNQEISSLVGENIQVIGASRTDAGVHALGNVAVFDTSSRIPPEKFAYALNQRLPSDVVIQESGETARDFHPRHCPCRKTYEYTILNRTFPLPQYRHTAHFEYGSLDIGAMQNACRAFVGEHDFGAFCSAGAQVKTTVRTIYRLEVAVQPLSGGSDSPTDKSSGRLIVIRVQGNGFLYNMVRIIAGTLLEVGKGHILPEHVKEIIASCDRGQAGPTAPARGLVLAEIEYPEGHLDNRADVER